MLPVQVWDLTTGENVGWEHLEDSITNLTNWVKTETERLWVTNKNQLLTELATYTGTPQPSEWARQHSYNYDPSTLPVGVKQQYRINKLVQHKLVTETASYVLNPNLNKQEHSFSHAINLGAVDKQMCILGWEEKTRTLTLEWKCWVTHYLIEFNMPEYVTRDRVLEKWCLPVVSPKGFKWSYHESVPPQNPKPSNNNYTIAGTDYGRVTPYFTTIVNQTGIIATYEASPRLQQVNNKRERLLKNKKNNQQKLNQYKKLNPSQNNSLLNQKAEVLIQENKRLAGKAHRLTQTIANQTGSELARKLAKHKLNLHVTENLKWAVGEKYGSRFIHSQLKQATNHNLNRKGIRVTEVSAQNNSQHCITCNQKITHTKNRITHCNNCSLKLNRDKLASLNMIKKTNRFPVILRINGVKHSVQPQFNVANKQQTSNLSRDPTNTT